MDGEAPAYDRILSGESKREKSPLSARIMTLSVISESSARISRSVRLHSRDLAGILDPMETLEASRISIVFSLLQRPFEAFSNSFVRYKDTP